MAAFEKLDLRSSRPPNLIDNMLTQEAAVVAENAQRLVINPFLAEVKGWAWGVLKWLGEYNETDNRG